MAPKLDMFFAMCGVCEYVFVLPAPAGDRCSHSDHLSPVGFTVFCYALLCCVCACVCGCVGLCGCVRVCVGVYVLL